MSNRGYLINSSSLTSDPAELERLRSQPGHVDGEVAESANRLLIPWFLCFRQSDLRPATCDFMELQLPCTTLEQAVRNLESSLPIFEAIAGDPQLARSYWELSCTLVRRLPLPYLTMNPIEVFMLGSPPSEAIAAHISGALSGDLTAVPHLKVLAEYDDSVPPYPLDVLYSMAGGGADAARAWNASVLDGGFQPDFQYVNWNTADATAEPHAPALPPDSVFGELRDVLQLVKSYVQAELPSSQGEQLGLLPSTPEHLQVDIYVRSVDAMRLEENTRLRSQLDELARSRLQPWCAKYGFGWKGFRFSSPEWARR